MVHPNEAIVREYLQAFNQGDLERVGELLADEVMIHFPGRNPISGDKRGKEEVMAFFRVMMERAGVGSTPPDVHDVLASDRPRSRTDDSTRGRDRRIGRRRL